MDRNLEELLERVKQADGPDETLDAAIAIALMPNAVIALKEEDGSVLLYTHWQYTASVDAALELVERCLGTNAWVLKRLQPGIYAAVVRRKAAQTLGQTPALALLAALMAALVEQQKEERAATVEEQPLASDEPLSEITAVDG